MTAAAAGLGFLLAVLWFDLMFDIQAWPHRRTPDAMPEAVVASIGTYYRRVTTDAHPMNRLVALAMLATLAAIITALARDGGWVPIVALALTGCAIAYAGVAIVPAAKRLGAAADELAVRRRLARSILAGHLGCWLAVATALAITLIAG